MKKYLRHVKRLWHGAILNLLTFSCVSCAVKPAPIVYDCPKVVLISSPVFKDKLTSSSTPDQVVKFWVARAKGYKQWHDVTVYQVDKINGV